MNDNNKELNENDINQVTGGTGTELKTIGIDLLTATAGLPEDEIEGTPVLKEASSHAIYGEGQKNIKV